MSKNDYNLVRSPIAIVWLLCLVLLLSPIQRHSKPRKAPLTHNQALKVREMAKHAWDGFYKYARDSDELRPISQSGYNWTKYALGYTAVDSMDTLYIMGLLQEYQQAKDIVLQMKFDHIDYEVNHFETNIRFLGGILSANELDPDPRLVKIAVDLADRLLRAFNTPTGIPYSRIDLANGNRKGGYVSIATAGTLQLEFQYLSDITGDPKYQDAALYALEQLQYMTKPIPGLFPTRLNVDKLEYPDQAMYGLGPENDSFYEYLLKIYIATKEPKFLDWYKISAKVNISDQALNKHLIVQQGDKIYAPDLIRNNHAHSFHHLVSFK